MALSRSMLLAASLCLLMSPASGARMAHRNKGAYKNHEGQAVAVLDSTASNAMDSKKLSQMLNLGVGLVTSTITGLSEEPADYEYVADSFSIQGWKLVKLFVPEQDHSSEGMKKAKNAWDKTFGGAADLANSIEDAVKTGDVSAVIHSVVSTIDLALQVCSEAMPHDAKYFDATSKAVKSLSSAWVEFAAKLGWLGSGASLAEVDASIAPEKLNKLLTTGVGILTAMMSGLSESPPDYEYVMDSLNLQGWKMVKLIVSEENHKSEGMKKAKAAWDRIFGEAAEIAEDVTKAITTGDVDAIVSSVLNTIDTALRTSADVWTDHKVVLEAVADLIQSTAAGVKGFLADIDVFPSALVQKSDEQWAAIIKGIAIPVVKELGEELLKKLGRGAMDWVEALAKSPSTQVSQPAVGAVWISHMEGTWGFQDGTMLSAYYHPTKEHTATTKGKLGEKRSVAAAGHWAVSTQSKGMRGNKAYYNHY